MTPDTIFRLLQVGVVAPYAFKASRDQENPYFNVGLKLVAGTILVANVPILLAAFKQYSEQSIRQWLADQAKPVRPAGARVIDSTASEVP